MTADSMAIARLKREHERMRILSGQISTILARDTPSDIEWLTQLRWDMASLVMSHLAYEDRNIYSALENDSRLHVRERAQKFRQELAQVFDRYSGHSKQWTPVRIQSDWTSYRTMALEFLRWLIDRADREERELFPLMRAERAEIEASRPVTVSWAREAFAMKDAIMRR